MRKCDQCAKPVRNGEDRKHNSKYLCEDCTLYIRMSRPRKTHWQYLGSIKNDYLLPGNKSRMP